MSLKTGAHHCHACGSKAHVTAMSHWEGETRRQLECACGERWLSVEAITKRLQPATTGYNGLKPAVTGSNGLQPVAAGCNGLEPVEKPGAVSPPNHIPEVAQPPAIERRGVGGVLPSDQIPVRSSDPDPSLVVNPNRARESNAPWPGTPTGAVRVRRVYTAAKTIQFLDVFNRYPRRDKKEAAAQIWQELAEDYPGGEDALRDAILARFSAGMLAKRPYSGPHGTRPCFDTFLAERRWEDPESDPDPQEAPHRPSESFREREERVREERLTETALAHLAGSERKPSGPSPREQWKQEQQQRKAGVA